MFLTPCKNEYVTTPIPRNLDDNMGRGSKAKETDTLTLCHTGELQISVAYGTRAQEGGCLGIRKPLRDGRRKIFQNDYVLSIASIRMAPRPSEFVAEILIPLSTKLTLSASRVDPPNPYTITQLEFADF
jgi:hypothetical protein